MIGLTTMLGGTTKTVCPSQSSFAPSISLGVALMLFAFSLSCATGNAAEKKLPPILNLAGEPVDPFRPSDAKAIVLIFVSNECPISNRYAPELRRLHAQFASKGVTFWLVHPDPDESVEAIRKHAKDYDYPFAVLRDPQHALVKRAKARVTPEAAVFLPAGRLVYHGRIDNRFVDFGKERPAPTKHDLQETLTAILGGKSVTNATSPAIGCYISDLH